MSSLWENPHSLYIMIHWCDLSTHSNMWWTHTDSPSKATVIRTRLHQLSRPEPKSFFKEREKDQVFCWSSSYLLIVKPPPIFRVYAADPVAGLRLVSHTLNVNHAWRSLASGFLTVTTVCRVACAGLQLGAAEWNPESSFEVRAAEELFLHSWGVLQHNINNTHLIIALSYRW